MPFTPVNFLQGEAKPYNNYGDLISDALAGYKAAREPAKMRTEEQRQRELVNQLQLGNENQAMANRYQEPILKQGLRAGEANIGLTNQQIEGLRIQNRLDKLHGERKMLAGIHSTEALTRGYQLDNEIKEETGMLNAWLDSQNKNLTNKGMMQQQEWYPIQQGLDAIGKMNLNEASSLENEINKDFSYRDRQIKQQQAESELKMALHNLRLRKQYDDELTQLSIQKQQGEITGQDYDNRIKEINSRYQNQLKQSEVAQAEANIGQTKAGTEYTQAGTKAQQQKNDIEAKYADAREALNQKMVSGQITATDYANERAAIDNKYQEDLKKNEVAQGKENIAAARAATQAQNFKNRLEGKFGEQDRKLAQQQAQKSVEQTGLQNATLWDNLQREMKYGDQTKAAELQNLYDASAANQAKVFKDMAEANKHAAAYKNVPAGSNPISEFSRGAQTQILKEQAEMQHKIESAEKGLRKLDALEAILDRNPEFSESWKLALTVPDREGVISSLAKVVVPGQNKRQRADAEEFKKLANDLVLDLGSATLGARFTDAKFRAMQASKPYLTNTKKANKAVINHLRKEFEPYKKFKKDFQKARYNYTLPFDYEKYSDVPLQDLSDEEFEAIALAQGLE